MASRLQTFRVVRGKILTVGIFSAGYLMYRYAALGSRFGYFMCDQQLTLTAAAVVMLPFGLLTLTIFIDGGYRQADWMVLSREERLKEILRIKGTSEPLGRYVLYGVIGIVLVELVSVIGCWLRA